ncbi:uncharacterized protein LOC118183326 [Stegodyphus dumicola]|uniref:uncharacterized protein LOC118183326 n=1 Tax=Stegodyphus dumicola TaxID=202533 RepID=UPI0015AC5EA5|nr:uncharacterized protein LOC118183326 [Stegodyphus dumicola]
MEELTKLSHNGNFTTSDLAATLTTSPTTDVYSINETDYQYILIGVYTFFVSLFFIGVTFLFLKRMKDACCSNSHPDIDEYDALRSDDLVHDCQNGNCCVHSIQYESDLDRPTTNIHYTDESEFDNVSLDPRETGGTVATQEEHPPQYEGPPSYISDAFS